MAKGSTRGMAKGHGQGLLPRNHNTDMCEYTVISLTMVT